MSLFTNLAVLGASGFDNGGAAYAWKSDGTIIGTATPTTDVLHEGGCALSEADNRIYLICKDAVGGQICLGVFDGDGALIVERRFRDHDVSFGGARNVYVPEPGKVWVSIEDGTANFGQIWEYDKDGTFIQVLANNLRTGHTITNARAMTHIGDVLYFIAITAGAVFGNGIYRHQISTNTPLSPLLTPTGSLSWDLHRTADGKLLQSLDTSGARLVTTAGVVEHTYAAPPTGNIYGIVPDLDGTTFWAGTQDGFMYRLSLANGSTVSSFALGAGDDSDYTLATLDIPTVTVSLSGLASTVSAGLLALAMSLAPGASDALTVAAGSVDASLSGQAVTVALSGLGLTVGGGQFGTSGGSRVLTRTIVYRQRRYRRRTL